MTTIAFLGLGNMGGPMAANLVDAGHTVHGFDPQPGLKAAAEGKGAKVFDSGAEAVADIPDVDLTVECITHRFINAFDIDDIMSLRAATSSARSR